MSPFEQFRNELRIALAHLHDPDYRPSELLSLTMGYEPAGDASLIQADIIQAISQLEYPDDSPANIRTERDNEVLRHRYILRLTQEETADRLYMSVRSVRRAQRIATHALARQIWDYRLARNSVAGEKTDQSTTISSASDHPSTGNDIDWQSQVKEELAALQANSPEAIVDVQEAIEWAIAMESPLLASLGSVLTTDMPQDQLLAVMHPTILRQILIMAISQMTHDVESSEVNISVRPSRDYVSILVKCPTIPEQEAPDFRVIEEIVALKNGATNISIDEGQMILQIDIQAAGKTTVLVIDDNADLVHFYKRCTVGTRYRIIHAAQGERSCEAIAAAEPDIIILDIILPDVDGWELLSRLQKNQKTRALPVIICSIVVEEKLAMALGARAYLSKPVERHDLIQALDRALGQMPADNVRHQAHIEAAC
jgi:CheY-like chemotaxis protein